MSRSKKIKILHVLNTFGGGGAEQYVVNYTNSLIDNSVEVQIVAGAPFTIRDRLLKKIKLHEIKSHPGNRFGLLSYLVKLPLLIYEFYKIIKNEKIDIVQTHLPASALPAWIAAKLSKKIVYHSKMHMQVIASPFEKILFKFNLHKFFVKKYISFSKYSNFEMRKYWKINEKLIVLSSVAVDGNRFNPELYSSSKISSLKKILTINENCMVVSVVARLCEDKGVDLAILAFAAMESKNAVLLLAGDGPEKERLQALTLRVGVSSRVRFLGQVSLVSDVYAISDLILQTTKGPNIGMIALESMSMDTQLLIVTRNASEIKMAEDTFEHDNKLFIVNDNSHEIGKRLDYFTKNKIILKKNNTLRNACLLKHSHIDVFQDLTNEYKSSLNNFITSES